MWVFRRFSDVGGVGKITSPGFKYNCQLSVKFRNLSFTAVSKCEIGKMKLESPVRSHLKPFTSSVTCKSAGKCGGMRF